MRQTYSFINTKNQQSTLTTIISEHHAWRTLSGLQTTDYYAYRTALLNGCHLQRALFELRHPEVMICDLSNLEQIFNDMSDLQIVKTWHQINSAINQSKFEGMRKILGDGLSPEIAVSGPSKQKLLDFKNELIEKILPKLMEQKQSSHTQSTKRGISKNRLLTDTNDDTINFHNRFCAFYSAYISHEHWDNCITLNTRYIYEDHPVWHKIKTLSKNKLFLLSAGLPIALGYLAATGDEKIFFSEIHRQNDANLLTRDGEFLDIFPHKEITNEPWLIIDKSYTGGSLRQAGNMIRKIIGYKAEVKTLALFPKTFSAFMSSDYAVYGGKLFEVRLYASRLNRETWHTQLISEQPT
ncbi:hypothetical protein [Pseudomonas hamedanensis]|uniref:Uncharacterized protein n=1 Tax=Pseudomonas hamedanensis TaxID=2745504 RepID=A0A9E6TFE5_9PSED|nr:hypothetical protein [Pseudomonas hamedanensis]QXI16611.1 hypothetical protein HU739_022315 [Pseudomonas hamedanensis]